MKITVIIPHKNGGARLERCLASLQAQPEVKGYDFEFITVNDNGERGRDSLIADAYEHDTRFNTHYNIMTRGVSGARNTGIRAALKHGADWITFLDADDTWLPESTQALADAIEANPDAKIIELNHLRYYVETGETRNKYALPRCTYKFSTSNQAWCFVWNKLYRADLLKDIYFQEGLQYGEDEVFNIDVLAKYNEIVHDDRFIALKRYFDNKQSLSRIKDREGLLAHNDALIDCLNRHADKPEIARNICMLIGKHWQSPTFLQKFGGGAL